MARQILTEGIPNLQAPDNTNTAYEKINANFSELYSAEPIANFAGNINVAGNIHANGAEVIFPSTGGNISALGTASGNAVINITSGGPGAQELHAKFTQNSSANLYYNNAIRYETTSAGANVYQTTTFKSGLDSTEISGGTISLTSYSPQIIMYDQNNDDAMMKVDSGKFGLYWVPSVGVTSLVYEVDLDYYPTFSIDGLLRLAILTAEPASPADGMIAIADGTSWNPTGTGVETLVVRLNGAWRTAANA